MTRRHIPFPCAEDTLIGTLDEGDEHSGLLIVTGGNEIRSGAFSGLATLAARVASAGYPVFRFDRRGVGDSSGSNSGFHSAEHDLAAAIAAFRENSPHIQRIIAYGNCDAATALMLNAGGGYDALVLANPWTFEDDQSGVMPPEAIRARYVAKLRDPGEALRFLRGGVSLKKLASGVRTALKSSAPPSSLVEDMANAMASYDGQVRYLIAGRDRTGQAFRAVWQGGDNVEVRAEADHAFSKGEDSAWLLDQILSALNEQARQLDMG
ncbi:hydrolase 1, exosortase A system-associated [Aurantiacibacter marinus]|uniref:AB hydrolase-1 domain-containing protein n=1 Tax=Aurantiacibacter marinus TaxID=874156 RepID=A0A0H0XPR8_9SPHN|nr:hydrolase 1, exosortase A system-associated [Aurantiacibacter marinus]KLI64011.1 hypothetical protein AAV99_10025 [Aurantiacibacter marinus]